MIIVSAKENDFSWYCIREKDHKRPPLPSEFSFINELDGYYIGSDEKVVYLTFDAGYENGNVEKTLDVLKEHDVKGAFFILSNLINENPDLIVRMADEGHLICNHTSKHPDMTRIADMQAFESELKNLEHLCYEKTGKEVSEYFRPPEGKFNRQTLEFAKNLGYKTIFWSFAYADWDNNKQMSEAKAKEKILSNMHNGAIILLHPTSSTNAKILGDVISELKSNGYRFGTLEELK
jgi:peptidoglycan-N-acetylmuramic acid deacetylase